jgi:hypothetical protein
MNRIAWTSSVLGVAVVALAVSAFARRGSADSEPGRAAPADQTESDNVTAAPEAPRPEDAPRAKNGPRAAAAPAAAEAPKVTPVEKKDVAPPRPTEERRQLLETVGALTAAHAFQSYLNIGLIADGKAKGTYTDRDARKLLDSVLGLLDSVDKKLAALSKTDLDKADRLSLEDMRTLSSLLHKQGRELEAYWDSGKAEDEERYENVRKDSWAALNRLMGAR